MNLLFNANCSIGGGIQVCDSLIRVLADFPQHSFTVCASGEVLRSLGRFIPSKNIEIMPCPPQSILQRILGLYPGMDRIVRENKIDAVFTVFGPSYWRPKVPHLCGFAKPRYAYPESEFLKRQKWKVRFWVKKKIHLRSFLKDTDALVTENPEVTERLKQLYGYQNSHTVYNTFNPVFTNSELWDHSLKLPDFNGTTLLTIASYYSHKNFEIMVPVALQLEKKYPDFKFRFVLSITRAQFPTDITGLEKHFAFLGQVPISQCPYLYQQSQIMFLPTLLECFSATWAEAMVMQVPILTSDFSFARGICENAAVYVDPYSPDKIADSIYKLSLSEKLREEMVRNGNIVRRKFSDAKHRMEGYLAILNKIV